MEHFRKQFPVLKHCLYANTAASGLLSESLLEWRQEHDLDFLIGGSEVKQSQYEIISETKSTVARFFGAKRELVALVPNFSIGLNLLLEGLDKSKKVLLLENDYPSLNWPFEKRGFPILYVPVNENLEARILEIVERERIQVLALSLVQWINGIKIDLPFLKELKTSFPELLIVADGTQFYPSPDVRFEDCGIDVLGASAYKWMLGGYGCGFMLFSQSAAEQLAVPSIGFNSADIDLEARDKVRFSKHFEPGHLSTLSFGSMNFSLKLLADLGTEKMAAQNKKLMFHAKEKFSEQGLLETDVLNRKDHSTIFNVKGTDKTFKKLTDNRVVCSQRGSGIRLSFHSYNTLEEVDRIAEILKFS